MKILLIVPPNSLEERYGKLKVVGTTYPSLGLAAIGAVAEAGGHEVQLIDCEAAGLTYNDLEEKIRAWQPQIVGLQTFCNTIQRTLEIARRVKENISPGIKVVFGGVQATFFPAEHIADKNVDFVVIGEGEIIFKNLLDALANNFTDFSQVNGLAWKKNGEMIINPPEKLIENLDILPFPARHLFDWKLYHPSAQIRGKKTSLIITSRGCPFNCGFCFSHKTFGRTYRYMSPGRVIEEIKFLKEKYGVDGLQFYDDTLTFNKERIRELCDLMIAEKINLPWSCFTRVDCVTEDLLKKMKAAGCYQIFYGVEAGNQRLLNLMSKGITIEQIKNAFKWTKGAGIEALASFIIGLPTETEEEARASVKLAKEIGADYAHWELFTPYPGTNLYKIALEHGRLLTTDLSQYSPWRDEPVYLPNGRTAEELKATKQWIYRRFYLRPVFMLKRVKGLLNLPFSRLLKLIQGGLIMTFRK